MANMPESLPGHVWERIAFYSMTGVEQFLGPPTSLTALSLVSRSIYNKVALKFNPTLYAKIFVAKFDVSAIHRRFSDRWRTARCFAWELQRRSEVLVRLKRGRHIPSDLWVCLIMMTENDGKNERQLLEYGLLPQRLKRSILERFQGDPRDGWFLNATLDSLLLWLWWMVNPRENFEETLSNPEFSLALRFIVHAFVIRGHEFSVVHAPTEVFHYPMCTTIPRDVADSSQLPPIAEVPMLFHTLKVACLPVVQAAALCYTILQETRQIEHNLPRQDAFLHLNRATAVGSAFNGPSWEDHAEFHLSTRIHTATLEATHCLTTDFPYPEDLDGLEEELILTASVAYDSDWYRMVGGTDLWDGGSPLRGQVFLPGSLTGSWAGRIMLPAVEAPIFLHQGGPFESASVPLSPAPLYWDLQEHYCFEPNSALPIGLDDEQRDHLLNAFLPTSVEIQEQPGFIHVQENGTGQKYRYETLDPRELASWMTRESEEARWISAEHGVEIAERSSPVSTSGFPDSPSSDAVYIDDDDAFVDALSQHDSGITDIIITGKSSGYNAHAWGKCSIVGRVRPWDGMISLYRSPADPHQRYRGNWVFNGYLHDRNLVGRWRETATPIDDWGLECSFVASKQVPANDAQA